MQFLAAVGVNVAPLLASAVVAGVAIGLAAQSIGG
jgi:small-conductance mechanosensitive channel